MAYIKQIGIYYIKSTTNDMKVYIGSSVDMRARITAHFSALSRGNHRCAHLQRIYTKYGADSLSAGVIEDCVDITEEVLRIKERYHIDEFLKVFPRKHLMNSTLNTACPLDDHNVRDKQKQAAREFWKNNADFRQDTIARGTKRFKLLNQDETFCRARNTRLSELNKNKEFQRLRIEALVTVSARPVTCLDNNTQFVSVSEASRWLRSVGFDKAVSSPISACCKGKLKTAYKFRWSYT